ncbi:hypothetical protein M441DRAFT_341547 [Trichoderma asperellum CBS 433.97]|uniref:Uncharacterized protein n=1 Tax=Trichoderma asperellum (strain ATCC 204424 / CBS 433.97 / NBRC 101777) TaxID=1042311 RepID=A0A2T3ZH21_TRIA4|nr:hypothetical protein M441DRAFT_341547 [Trichoderma asperellum CBS 433.97]PTB44098.1 hypothetical protein M441DRAFT_341547 [Trichoderma asperellum CBS 433.97]
MCVHSRTCIAGSDTKAAQEGDKSSNEHGIAAGHPRDDNEHTHLKAGKRLRRGVSWAPERVRYPPSLPNVSLH